MAPFIDSVSRWHDLYMLVGTASATLIGLLFVAASVGSRFYTESRLPAMRAFLSPTVVHFSSVLSSCLIAVIPAQSWTLIGILITGDGLFGVVYAGFVWRGMKRHGFHSTLDLEDRVWYAAMPALGHAITASAGITLLFRNATGCALLALAMGVLLLVGIRNAWDITVWAVIKSPQ
jgi:hypothetical protein